MPRNNCRGKDYGKLHGNPNPNSILIPNASFLLWHAATCCGICRGISEMRIIWLVRGTVRDMRDRRDICRFSPGQWDEKVKNDVHPFRTGLSPGSEPSTSTAVRMWPPHEQYVVPPPRAQAGIPVLQVLTPAPALIQQIALKANDHDDSVRGIINFSTRV